MDEQRPDRGSADRLGDEAYLGIDVGTSGVRAAVLDGSGRVLGRGAEPLHSDRRRGVRHEQDPDEWWAALCVAVRQALVCVGDAVGDIGDSSAANGGAANGGGVNGSNWNGGRASGGAANGRRGGLSVRIAAVAVAATSGTLLVEDARGRPVTAGVLYDDGRAVGLADRVAAAGATVWSRSGIVAQPTWALPRALWLLHHTQLPPGGRVVHQGDHLVRRLTGEPVPTDTSQALKTGVDLITGDWPAAVLTELGLDPAVFPAVVGPGTPIGVVGPAAAAATGLPAGAQVRAGMTDGCAAQIGAGALGPGAWTTVLGTTLVLKGVSDLPLADPSGAFYSHRHPDTGWLPGGASNAGAGFLASWFGPDLHGLSEAAGRDTGTAVTYPLRGAGERFPFTDAAARRFTIGQADGPVARFAAALRGLACVERLAYERVRGLGAPVLGPIRSSGGATRNVHLTQLRADLLGRSVQVAAQGGAAIGMAVLAAAGPGRVAETAARMLPPGREFEPDAVRHGRLLEVYGRFVGELRRRGWLDVEPGTFGTEGDSDSSRVIEQSRR